MKSGLVILGGGVTGLWAAISAKRRDLFTDVVIVDKLPRLGGILKQHKNKGYTFEFGVHVYNPNDERNKDIFKRADGKLINDRKVIYRSKPFGGSPVDIPYPVQDHIGKTAIPVITAYGFDPSVYKGASLHDFAISTFGTEFCNRFFFPFNSRVWTIKPEEMDSDWISGRVKLPSEKKEHWGKNASFYHAPGDDITGVLTSEASSLGVKFMWAEPSSIDVKNKSITLKFIDGEADEEISLEYSAIVSTIPINELLALGGIVEFEGIKSNAVLSIGIGTESIQLDPRLDGIHWLYMDVKRTPIHRISFLHNFHSSMTPNADAISLLLEIPFRAGFTDFSSMPSWFWSIISADADQINSSGWRDFNIHDGDLSSIIYDFKAFDFFSAWPATLRDESFAISAKIGRGYPIPTRGVRRGIASIKSVLVADHIYSVGRWGSHAYFNLEDNFDDVEAAFAYMVHKTPTNENDYLFSTKYYKAYDKR